MLGREADTPLTEPSQPYMLLIGKEVGGAPLEPSQSYMNLGRLKTSLEALLSDTFRHHFYTNGKLDEVNEQDPEGIKLIKHGLLAIEDARLLPANAKQFIQFKEIFLITPPFLAQYLFDLYPTLIRLGKRLHFLQAACIKPPAALPKKEAGDAPCFEVSNPSKDLPAYLLSFIFQPMLDELAKGHELLAPLFRQAPFIFSGTLDDPAKHYPSSITEPPPQKTEQQEEEPWYKPLNFLRVAKVNLHAAVPDFRTNDKDYNKYGFHTASFRLAPPNEFGLAVTSLILGIHNLIWDLNQLKKEKSSQIIQLSTLVKNLKHLSKISQFDWQNTPNHLLELAQKQYDKYLSLIVGHEWSTLNEIMSHIREIELAYHLKPGTLLYLFRSSITALQLHLIDRSIYVDHPCLAPLQDTNLTPTSSYAADARKEHIAAVEKERQSKEINLAIAILKKRNLVCLLNTAKNTQINPAECLDSKNRLAMLYACAHGFDSCPPEKAFNNANRLANELTNPKNIIALLLKLKSKVTTYEDEMVLHEIAIQLMVGGFVQHEYANKDFQQILFFKAKEQDIEASNERIFADLLTKIEMGRFISIMNSRPNENISDRRALKLFFMASENKLLSKRNLHTLLALSSQSTLPAILTTLRERASNTKNETLKIQIALFMAKLAFSDKTSAKEIFSTDPQKPTRYEAFLKQYCLPYHPVLFYEASLQTNPVMIKNDISKFTYRELLISNINIITLMFYAFPENKSNPNFLKELESDSSKLAQLIFSFMNQYVSRGSCAERKLNALYASVLLIKNNKHARLAVFNNYIENDGHTDAPMLRGLNMLQNKTDLFFKQLKQDLISELQVKLNVVHSSPPLPNAVDKNSYDDIKKKIEFYKSRITKFQTRLKNNTVKGTWFLYRDYSEIQKISHDIQFMLAAYKTLPPSIMQVRSILSSYIRDRSSSFLFILHLSKMRRDKVFLAQSFLKTLDEHICKYGEDNAYPLQEEVFKSMLAFQKAHRDANLEHAHDRLTRDIAAICRLDKSKSFSMPSTGSPTLAS